MITIQIDKANLESIVKEELKRRLDEIEHRYTFWDSKELQRRTCMSWNTIQQQFFFDDRFPKYRVGGKWLFPAKAAEEFLVEWLQKQGEK